MTPQRRLDNRTPDDHADVAADAGRIVTLAPGSGTSGTISTCSHQLRILSQRSLAKVPNAISGVHAVKAGDRILKLPRY